MLKLDLQNIRKIFIRSTNWVGDAVMTTPAMGAVRATFPDAHVSVGANPLVAELFSFHPYCDRVLLFDKKDSHRGMKGFLRFCAELRKSEFDLAILFQNAFEAALMARISGIPKRAGYGSDCRGFLLTHSIPRSAQEKRLHHTDYYLNLLRKLGIEGGDGRLVLQCSPEENSWAQDLLEHRFWVAINPGATYGSAKRWYPERFAATADAIAEDFGARILLLGGPSEVEIGQEIEEAMRSRFLNLIGKTSLRQLMALLSRCKLLVTNDSGPMHIAAALEVPIVALFGPTDHTTTSPLSASSRIIRKHVDCAPCLKRHCPTDHRCMGTITVDDVMSEVRSLIAN